MFYLVIFYILVAILFVSVAICIWVGWCFMNDSFPFLWPIKVARVVVSLFVSMFYIASLNIFLMACACDNEGGKWKHLFFQLGECCSTSQVMQQFCVQRSAQAGSKKRCLTLDELCLAATSWQHAHA